MVNARKNLAGIAIVVAGAAWMLAACANERGPHPNLPTIGILTSFTSQNLCNLGVSPAVRLSAVPEGTASYKLRITNISVLSGLRVEVSLKADGSLIPEGAIGNFDAPCPGELQTFNYRVEVMALGVDGRPLAYNWAFASARSLTRQLESEQHQATGRVARPDPSSPISASRPVFFTQ